MNDAGRRRLYKTFNGGFTLTKGNFLVCETLQSIIKKFEFKVNRKV
jgi:hypothetical protein